MEARRLQTVDPMSFVARRFGSAGFVPPEREGREEILFREGDVRHESMTCPAPTESGVSLRSPVVLIVGVDDDLARMCKAFAVEVDVGIVRVSQGIAASRAIHEARPTVVGIAHALWRDEKAAITEAARQAGARVIELPAFAPKDWMALRLVKAAMSETLPAAAG